MKVLLDENLPHRLRHELSGHDVFTVRFLGWNGLKNGDLLRRAAKEGFDVLVTIDAGIRYEQNPTTLPCAVLAIRALSNAFEDIEPLLPDITSALKNLTPRTFSVVG